jgi:hypothetical protein
MLQRLGTKGGLINPPIAVEPDARTIAELLKLAKLLDALLRKMKNPGPSTRVQLSIVSWCVANFNASKVGHIGQSTLRGR